MSSSFRTWLNELSGKSLGKKRPNRRLKRKPLASLWSMSEVLEDRCLLSVSVLGSTASTSGSGSSPLTLSSFSVGAGTNRLLAVTTGQFPGGIASVTFGGISLTQAVSADGSNAGSANIWYLPLLDSASATTGDVIVTYTDFQSEDFVTATAFSGVNQTTPINPVKSTNSSASVSVSSASGDMVLDSIETGPTTGTLAAGGGQTQLASLGPVFSTDHGASIAPGAASVAMNWTGTSTYIGHAGVDIQQVFTAATSSAVTTSQSPAPYGTPITFTDAVSALSGSVAPTQGSVDFVDTTTGVDLGAGAFQGSSALTSTWSLTTGATTLNATSGDTITATYSPGSGFLGSSGTVTQVITPSPLVYNIPADHNSHDLTLELDGAGTTLEIFDNNALVASMPYEDASSVDITNAPNQADTLTVDYTHGFIALPISFDGGAGTGSHSLSVVDTSSNGISTNDVYSPGPGLGAGTLTLNHQIAVNSTTSPSSNAQTVGVGGSSTISFVNLTPVLDTVPGTLTVDGTNGNDTITYAAGIADPVNDGLVTVNNLESMEFSNKSTLTINTGLGVDTVIDDNANSPMGLTNDIAVNAGDPNAGDTLIYKLLDGDQTTVSASAQGVGKVTVATPPNPANVDYNGFANINLVGKLSVNDSIDIEGENATFNDYVVAPSTVIGSGEITGTLDAVNIFNMSAATYTIPNITYSGLAPKTSSSSPRAAISFDTQNSIFTGAGIGYEGQPTGGTFINVTGGTLTDAYNDGGNDPYASIYNGASFALYQINAQPNVAISVTENDTIPVYVKGKGLGSADTLRVNGDGTDPMNLDINDGSVDAGFFAGVYYSGISSLVINAEGQALTVFGPPGTSNITIQPTSNINANIILGAAFPTFSATNVTSLLVDPSAIDNSVTIEGTSVGDQITATGGAAGVNPTVQVGSLLAVTLAMNDTRAVDINGGTGDNNLTVDSTAGAFVIPITYNGGPGNNNSLTLQGGTETHEFYTAGPLPGAGSDTMSFAAGSQSVEFSNLAPVFDSVAGPLDVNGTNGSDDITYGEGTLASDGEVSVNSFEPIIFTNKTTLDLNGQFGNDKFTVDNDLTPTGLTAINVNGGTGLDSLLVNAYNNTVNVSTAGTVAVNGQPPIAYNSTEAISIINALDSINVAPATINGQEGKALNNVGVGTFTGGPVGAVAADFVASINWGDGHTGTGKVTGSAGSFSVTGSHTYAEEGGYSPVVTVTDKKVIGSTTVSGVPITVFYTTPLSSVINDTATITDPNVVASAITTPVVTIATGANTGTIKLATFTDPGGVESLSDYSASVNWGDGHTTTTGTGLSLTQSGGVFTISGNHTYTVAGTYSPVVTISHEATTPQVVHDTGRIVVVTPTTIHGSTATFTGHEGRVTSNGTVASFTSVNTSAPTTSFSAVINWGDGSPNSTGAIVKDSAGHFHVSGSHLYAEEVTYPITVTIKQVGGSTITVGSKAVISPSPLDTLKGVGTLFEPLAEATFTNVVLGTFRDQSSTERDPATYTGTVNWGDGHSTTAKFVFVTSTYNVGSYWKIEGSHKYTAKGNFTVTLTFHDVGGPIVNSVITSKISVQ